MKEQIMKIIDSHNATVNAWATCDVKFPADSIFKLMVIPCKMASEGLEIVHLARENGIDAKCNMQSGEITVYGNL